MKGEKIGDEKERDIVPVIVLNTKKKKEIMSLHGCVPIFAACIYRKDSKSMSYEPCMY